MTAVNIHQDCSRPQETAFEVRAGLITDIPPSWGVQRFGFGD